MAGREHGLKAAHVNWRHVAGLDGQCPAVQPSGIQGHASLIRADVQRFAVGEWSCRLKKISVTLGADLQLDL